MKCIKFGSLLLDFAYAYWFIFCGDDFFALLYITLTGFYVSLIIDNSEAEIH
jgi:hypothetical protein